MQIKMTDNGRSTAYLVFIWQMNMKRIGLYVVVHYISSSASIY